MFFVLTHFSKLLPTFTLGWTSVHVCSITQPLQFLTGNSFFVRTQLQHYKPLITTNCSSLTRLFICSSHLLLCTSHQDIPPLLPCRSVCNHVYFNCIHHIHKTLLPWPHHFNCTRFPTSTVLCIRPPQAQEEKTTAAPAPAPAPAPATSVTTAVTTSTTTATAATTATSHSRAYPCLSVMMQ